MELHGQTVVLTGASRGIGRALAIALAKSGCRLLLTGYECDELAALTSYLTVELGATVTSFPADLTLASDRQNFLDWVNGNSQPPDMLVNNAGLGYFCRFTSARHQDIERTIQLNTYVPVLLTRELLPILRQRPQAKVVFISSSIARLPYPGLAIYGATKGFLSSFSESLACELHGTSVSVLCFHPGFTDTHFLSSAGMNMSRIPKMFVHTPEATASGIVDAIRSDRIWIYADAGIRFGIALASLLPRSIKTRLFSNLFWRLPDE